MFKNKIRWLSYGAMLFAIVGLTGCASTAIPSSVVQTIPNLHKYAKSVYVTVSITPTPGESLLERSERVTSKTWEQLVKQSIINTQLFFQIYDEPGADYVLNISPYKMPKLEGFHFNMFSDMTLQMESEWTLTDAVSNKVVMRKIIKTTHSAGADHMEAYAKHVITKAGLVQKNIQEGLLAVSKLNLE